MQTRFFSHAPFQNERRKGSNPTLSVLTVGRDSPRLRALSGIAAKRELRQSPALLRLLQRLFHLAYGLREADKDGARDKRVTDVEFGKVGNAHHLGNMGKTDAVTGMHFQPQRMGEISGGDETLQFLPVLGTGRVGVCNSTMGAPTAAEASTCSASGSMNMLTQTF